MRWWSSCRANPAMPGGSKGRLLPRRHLRAAPAPSRDCARGILFPGFPTRHLLCLCSLRTRWFHHGDVRFLESPGEKKKYIHQTRFLRHDASWKGNRRSFLIWAISVRMKNVSGRVGRKLLRIGYRMSEKFQISPTWNYWNERSSATITGRESEGKKVTV